MSRQSGAFVYQGAGRKVAADADITLRSCKDEACAIQWCLARHNHQEARCHAAISRWRQCCEAALPGERGAAAAVASSTVTPTPSSAQMGADAK